VEANVFLLTDRRPSLLPSPNEGMSLAHSQPATQTLLDDLRGDDGMAWVPASAWLTRLNIDATASDLIYDLAVDVRGQNQPSRRAAGLEIAVASADDTLGWIAGGVAASLLVTGAVVGVTTRRQS
jgi:hypothetical protein